MSCDKHGRTNGTLCQECDMEALERHTPERSTAEYAWMDEARAAAAQCWCDAETSGIEMDPRLAEAVAKRIAIWMQTAAQYSRNADYWRDRVSSEKASVTEAGTEARREHERRLLDKRLRGRQRVESEFEEAQVCPRCGDEWRGQACVADCPLWAQWNAAQQVPATPRAQGKSGQSGVTQPAAAAATPRTDAAATLQVAPGLRKEIVDAEFARRLECENGELRREIDAKQAEIDRLMIEYCPDEMTPEQTEEWAQHQRPVEDAAAPPGDHPRVSAVMAGWEPLDVPPSPRPAVARACACECLGAAIRAELGGSARSKGMSNEQAYWNEMYQSACEQRRPFIQLRPSVFIDGNQWCAMYGDNLQDGVAGFGASPELAAWDFDKQWCKRLEQRTLSASASTSNEIIEALVAHNDNARSFFQIANRIATEMGTHALQTNFGAFAETTKRMLEKYHAVTNEARALKNAPDSKVKP